MEKICGFNIITNPGIPYLDSLLRGSSMSLVSGQLPFLGLFICGRFFFILYAYC